MDTRTEIGDGPGADDASRSVAAVDQATDDEPSAYDAWIEALRTRPGADRVDSVPTDPVRRMTKRIIFPVSREGRIIFSAHGSGREH